MYISEIFEAQSSYGTKTNVYDIIKKCGKHFSKPSLCQITWSLLEQHTISLLNEVISKAQSIYYCGSGVSRIKRCGVGTSPRVWSEGQEVRGYRQLESTRGVDASIEPRVRCVNERDHWGRSNSKIITHTASIHSMAMCVCVFRQILEFGTAQKHIISKSM